MTYSTMILSLITKVQLHKFCFHLLAFQIGMSVFSILSVLDSHKVDSVRHVDSCGAPVCFIFLIFRIFRPLCTAPLPRE
jgi:hypothetical protein